MCHARAAPCGFRHLGFDTEWTPIIVRGQTCDCDLVQLATPSKCLLVRLNQMEGSVPHKLRALMEAEKPLKVASSLNRDLSCRICIYYLFSYQAFSEWMSFLGRSGGEFERMPL